MLDNMEIQNLTQLRFDQNMAYKGFSYRIYPNRTQEQSINQMLGNARWVYNWALARRIEAYQKDKTKMSAFTLMKELPKMKAKPEYEWLNLSVAQSLQQSIVNMEKAFTRFFREKNGFPRFKRKHGKQQTVGFPQNTKIDFDTNRVWIQKLGWIPARLSRSFEGKIKTAVIKKTATGKFFVSLTIENETKSAKQKPICKAKAVGIDTGIKTFATLSDGTAIENPKHLKTSLGRLKVLQRRVSRKMRGSKNRRKAVIRLARYHEYVANQRRDFLHKTTRRIANGYETVVCENLNIVGMVKNHHLAQSISDLGLSEFYRMLKYKMADRGGNYLVIGRFQPSSKMCSCGKINSKLTLADREWTCESCGATHQRDLLAAQNILKFGLQKQNTVGTTGSGF
jgi:putative transposase